MRYVLASASPRRKELLSLLGIEFEVIPAQKEEKIERVKLEEIVQSLANQKANEVAEELSGDFCVIGADTLVSYKGEVLGKPADDEEAFGMISMLSDRTHQVYTGVCVQYQKDGKRDEISFFEKTDVTLYPIDRFEIRDYIKTKDSFDKAGGYGIQGSFGKHVKSINGEYNNVVGFPVGRFYNEMFKKGWI
ncbi:septum formation protein [Aequitasia blattaphilus]|uniref:dTTP/UTP pyrophosphatase n=1 Tax=Aequitasia blattaphilus TaxID=2949332 RepID=A0ABT1E5P6_9FIRM|nr:Maf family protein [Aequitasia blattaphilus]MCP1101145.1 Maf family protein [Aequitasia blattaphilus]MCR8613785.1 Maf family protein [Aequitasia blattaphilus]